MAVMEETVTEVAMVEVAEVAVLDRRLASRRCRRHMGDTGAETNR